MDDERHSNESMVLGSSPGMSRLSWWNTNEENIPYQKNELKIVLYCVLKIMI